MILSSVQTEAITDAVTCMDEAMQHLTKAALDKTQCGAGRLAAGLLLGQLRAVFEMAGEVLEAHDSSTVDADGNILIPF